MDPAGIERSRALWNRRALDLSSDEALARILHRGEIATWRALYRMARSDKALRARIRQIVLTVPVALPHFWLAAFASLGEEVDVGAAAPDYYEVTAA